MALFQLRRQAGKLGSLVISVCLLLYLSISCQPKVQEMTDVERIEIDEIAKQLFLECE